MGHASADAAGGHRLARDRAVAAAPAGSAGDTRRVDGVDGNFALHDLPQPHGAAIRDHDPARVRRRRRILAMVAGRRSPLALGRCLCLLCLSCRLAAPDHAAVHFAAFYLLRHYFVARFLRADAGGGVAQDSRTVFARCAYLRVACARLVAADAQRLGRARGQGWRRFGDIGKRVSQHASVLRQRQLAGVHNDGAVASGRRAYVVAA